MASAETVRLLAADAWAGDPATGAPNRQTPEDAGLTRTLGFTLAYQQQDSGFYPQRRVFNQRYYEWDLAFQHKGIVMGVPEYHAGINYAQHAFCQVEGMLYVALVANGPASGNVTSPTATPNTVWREY